MDAWLHIRTEHFDLAESLEDVVLTMEHPDYREHITVVNAKWLAERDGQITVTIPGGSPKDRLT